MCDLFFPALGSLRIWKTGKSRGIFVSRKVGEFCELGSKVREFFLKQYKNSKAEKNLVDNGQGIPEFCQVKVREFCFGDRVQTLI